MRRAQGKAERMLQAVFEMRGFSSFSRVYRLPSDDYNRVGPRSVTLAFLEQGRSSNCTTIVLGSGLIGLPRLPGVLDAR